MANQRTSLLLVARPGSLRDSLEALLSTLPHIEAVDTRGLTPNTWEDGTDAHSVLVLVALEPGVSEAEMRLIVGRISIGLPWAPLIFLVNDVQQQEQAEAAGAATVLLTGIPAERLVTAIVRLMPHVEADDERAAPKARSVSTASAADGRLGGHGIE